MIVPQVSKKLSVYVGNNGSWGWELYCTEHAPKEDVQIVNIDDYERMEEDQSVYYGCLLCSGNHCSFLMPTKQELIS